MLSNSAYLLELELDRSRTQSCHSLDHVNADAKGVGFQLAGQMYEKTVSVAIDASRSPSVVALDEIACLICYQRASDRCRKL